MARLYVSTARSSSPLLTGTDFDDRRLGAHVEHFRQRADCEFHVAEIEDLTGIEDQAALLERLESGDLGAHRVTAAEQRNDRERPVANRDDLASDDPFSSSIAVTCAPGMAPPCSSMSLP
jgi:hypothetical protein